MPEIAIIGGSVTIDECDIPLATRHRWYLKDDGYVMRSNKGGSGPHTIYIHRAIMNAPAGVEVDHVDGDRLNNIRANLRLCTRSQNEIGKATRPHSSHFRGVSWDRRRGKWSASIQVRGRGMRIGYYTDEIRAARCYDDAARTWFGEFARLNFPRTGELPVIFREAKAS